MKCLLLVLCWDLYSTDKNPAEISILEVPFLQDLWEVICLSNSHPIRHTSKRAGDKQRAGTEIRVPNRAIHTCIGTKHGRDRGGERQN